MEYNIIVEYSIQVLFKNKLNIPVSSHKRTKHIILFGIIIIEVIPLELVGGLFYVKRIQNIHCPW